MKQKIFFFFTLIFCLNLFNVSPLDINHAYAQDIASKKTLILTDRYNEHFLSPYLSYYDVKDTNKASEILELNGRAAIEDKTPYKIIKVSPNSDDIWLGFDVQNRATDKKWAISLGTTLDGRFGLFDQINFFTIAEDRNQIIKNKVNQNGLYQIYLPEFTRVRVLIKLKSYAALTSMIPFKLVEVEQNSLYERINKIYIFCALLVGLASFFAAISLIKMKPAYLFFSAYYMILVTILGAQNNLFFSVFLNNSMALPLLLYLLCVASFMTAKLFWRVKYKPKFIQFLFNAYTVLTFIVIMTGLYVVDDYPTLQSSLIYIPIILTFFIIPIVSIFFSQNSHNETTPYMFGWFILLFGIMISLLPFVGIMQPVSTAVNAYWFALIPQAFFFIIATKIKLSGQEEDIQSQMMRIDETDSVSRLRESRENKEQDRLLKVIEQERKVLGELRKSEARRTEEMRKAKDQADQANNAKSAFLAVVTHEIRTPMTGIMGMIKLLMESNLSKDQKTYAQTIQDSSDAMLALLNDILDFEKIEQGKMSFEEIPMDLHRVVQGVATLMNGHAIQKKIELNVKIGENLPQNVIGDPTRLRQVLLNLTGNAVKFTEEGGVTITAERIDNSNLEDTNICEIYFGISDSGIGISKEVQESLFTPFSQANNTISRKFGGTGLGLAISKGLVQAMGSEININSNEGEGSTFFFILKMPIIETEDEDELKPNTIEEEKKLDKEITAKNILVVDDNAINLNVVSGLLAKLPHNITTVDSAEKAIAIVETEDFDLVLMDIELPMMKGDDAAKIIRQSENTNVKDVPIIALTGNLMPDDVSNYETCGMNGVLAKPIDPDELIRTVNQSSYKKHISPLKPASMVGEKNIANQKQETKPSLKPLTVADEIKIPTPKEETGTSTDNQEVQIAQKSSALDYEMLGTLKNHLKDNDIKEMLNDVIAKCDEMMVEIRSLIEKKDLKSISAKCHDMRGMAGNFGLAELSEKAGKIEKAIKEDKTDLISYDIEDLGTKEKKAIEALQTWLNENLK